MASPSRRLAENPTGQADVGNGIWFSALSRQHLRPSVQSECCFCEKRMSSALYGNQARKPVPASPSRRLAENPTGGRREQNPAQRLSRRCLQPPFIWSAVYAKSGCPMRYTEIKRRSLSWRLLPGGWPVSRQAGVGNRIWFSAFRGDASNRPFIWSAVYAKSGCPMRHTESYTKDALTLLPNCWPRTRQDKRTPGMEPGAAPFAAFSNRLPHWKSEFEVLCLRGACAGLTPAVALPAAFVSFAESGAIWPGISLLCAPCRLSRVRCAGSGRFCGAFPLDPP